MRKMLDVCKPETIVEVRHLEKELNTIVLWPTHENNVHLLTTRMMTLLQEIHAKTGTHSYTDQRFVTNLFRALETSPTEKFLSFVDQLKSSWIMEDISLPSEIIKKLDKMHYNMVANGSWINTKEKDTKIVVLTTMVNDMKMKYGALAKKVSFKGEPKSGSSKKKGGGKTEDGKKPTKTRCPEWQVTKKGNTIEHEGRKYVWCTKHTSKDGSINGLYMPSPHDHDEWAKAKADKTAAFKKRKEDAKKSGNKHASPAKKPKTEDFKFALSSKLTSELVTHCHRGQAEAENMFDSIYKDIVVVSRCPSRCRHRCHRRRRHRRHRPSPSLLSSYPVAPLPIAPLPSPSSSRIAIVVVVIVSHRAAAHRAVAVAIVARRAVAIIVAFVARRAVAFAIDVDVIVAHCHHRRLCCIPSHRHPSRRCHRCRRRRPPP